MDLLDIGIYIGFGLFGFSILAMILMEAFNLVKDPKSLIKVGLILVGVVVLFFISWSMSSNAVTAKYIASGVGEGSSQLIGAGLIMLYFFVFAALAGMIVSEIYKAFK
jgi:hypothetical protein